MIRLNPAASITEEFAEKVRSENRNDRLMKLAPIFVLVVLVAVFTATCGISFISGGNLLNILNQMALPPGGGARADLRDHAGEHRSVD